MLRILRDIILVVEKGIQGWPKVSNILKWREILKTKKSDHNNYGTQVI